MALVESLVTQFYIGGQW